MTSIQERLQIKREPLDKWSIREQLCLAVARNSDQNLTSVSRALKPFGEPNRPADWFVQKNCAAQYNSLLANCETPKRKKRNSGAPEAVIETPAESVLKKLLSERKAELERLLAEEKTEYLKLQKDITLLQSGNVSEEQLDIWCKEIDDEEHKKEQEAQAYAKWLQERELRKQEIERAWRPIKPAPLAIGQKRKNSESLDGLGADSDNAEDHSSNAATPQPETPKPALSPLLTSLLKSPSQVPPATSSSSILHSAITNQRPTNTNTNPMIASLLNSSPGVTVSPGLQQLVTSAIGQQQEEGVSSEHVEPANQAEVVNDILEDANLPNIKLDDILVSDLIADPEQHLELDGNGDININLELEDFEETEVEIKQEMKVEDKPPEKEAPSVDPFEFQEDPEVFEPKPTKSDKPNIPLYQQIQSTKSEISTDCPDVNIIEDTKDSDEAKSPTTTTTTTITEDDDDDEASKPEIIEDTSSKDKSTASGDGRVEIVEVVVMDEDEDDKELNKSQIENIVHTIKTEVIEADEDNKEDVEICQEVSQTSTVFEEPPETPEDKEAPSTSLQHDIEIKKEPEINLDAPTTSVETSTLTADFSEELYDDIAMEVKVDKSGKAKRDYSRTKKKDDKEFDVLLVLEKSQREDSETAEESMSDRDFVKDPKSRIKSENERSSSPWTEEEEISSIRTRRRLSTPATPIDSVPCSPVSSIYYDDDRDYKHWKKSILMVYNRLASNKSASLFLKPISDDYAPGYSSIVYRPMDLTTIRKNIENGITRTTQEFQRDVLLMVNNAIMYNKTNDTIYNMARQMQQESVQQIQILLQAQNQVDTPLRRETRTSEPGSKRKRGNEENSRSKKRKED